MKIAVLLGGTTEERLVSIASGAQIVRTLREMGHDVVSCDTAFGVLNQAEEDRIFSVPAGEAPPDVGSIPKNDLAADLLVKEPALRGADLVFNALHGGSGEDGTIAAILHHLGIPYTGSEPLPSALATHKGIAKVMYREAGILTPDWEVTTKPLPTLPSKFEFPVIVKPRNGGSTVGVYKVHNATDFVAAQKEALSIDSQILIERFVEGQEYVVGVLDERALGVGMIRLTGAELFDYRSKYHPGGCEEIFPAPVNAALTHKLQELAVRAHKALLLGSYSRSDFIHDTEDRIWCLETNVLPGMTSTSLMPQSAAAAGLSFADLCESIIKLVKR